MSMDPITRKRVKDAVQEDLADRISRITSGASDEAIKQLINEVVSEARIDNETMGPDEAAELIEYLTNEFLYFGPLQPLLSDPTISEIMVNGGGLDEHGNMKPHQVWIERRGKLEFCPDVRFDDEEHVRRIANRICSRQGRRLDDSNPIEDASLPDGSRFNGTIYPLSVDGTSFNIRRFQKDSVGYDQYIGFGTATPDMMEFLATCTAARCSILISGGTGSGKTTLLNILSGFIPDGERIITIEDTAELLVHEHHRHVVRYESRKPNSEGTGAVTLNDHLVAALRKRPDRIIVGECRGPEAYTMLEAMNTGHEGSMTTIHANDPIAALVRLTTLVKQGDSTLSEDTIKTKIASALDLVVQVTRLSDGSRKITSIQAIGNFVDGNIQHDELFRFVREGIDERNKVIGRHVKFNAQPKDIREKIESQGWSYNPKWLLDEERPF